MKTIKMLWSYSMIKKWHFLIGMVLLVLAVATDLAGPLIIRRVIDDIIAPSLKGTLDVNLLIQFLGLFLGLAVLTAIFRYLSFLALTIGANTVIRSMRDELYDHVQHLPIHFFDNLAAGKVVSRITNDTEQLRIFYVIAVGQMLTNFCYLIGIYVALGRLNPVYGLAALALVPVFIFWAVIYQKYAAPYNKKIRHLIGEVNGKLNESIQGMSIIQAFQQETTIEKEFDETNEEWFDYSQKFTMLDSIASYSFVEVIKNFSLLLLVLYFGRGYLAGSLVVSVGLLYVFVDYTTRLFQPIQGIVSQWAYLQTALVSAERIFELRETPMEVEEKKELILTKGEVTFDHVSFAYEEEKYVLNDISFTTKQGETVALVGHTGSGKSSIMNLLFRFYDPAKGAIYLDSVATTSVSRKSVRKQMGIVLQDPYLFKGTIASNVSLGNKEITRERVRQAIEAVGGDILLQNMPQGIDEPVVDKGATLSSGQRQLISFARALAFDPAILILDEATSNIDTETEEMIQHAMSVVKEGRTTFIIAHRLSTIQYADQILVMDKGMIAERGTHESLLKLNGQYAQMYRTQAKQKKA
ncbi:MULTISPECIES: ABC transporter ATP-binding protein [Carnobacterium]|uniref:ABC transporter ATP-binding protein n=1 Tax=Carnobacterium antarcticum TaxID=2126436 RepID=A0ABW4NQE5_9LACT|nr:MULTISPECIES: ABC transporter ATP-binding protein [unclassified Carnobacterium]ALV21328.1 Lipid A export ATP-binding/permease protein MsbA [Carnobacterium sp. CP1]QQP69350.1 ABC transporter ATP-binding protein [Carnobacterium sp. CS13]